MSISTHNKRQLIHIIYDNYYTKEHIGTNHMSISTHTTGQLVHKL